MTQKRIKSLLAATCICGLTALNAMDVYPKIFPADTTAKIQVEGMNPEWLDDPSLLSVGYIRDDGAFSNGKRAGWQDWEPVQSFAVNDQLLTLTFPLTGEHEHTFRVAVKDADGKESQPVFIRVYSLEDDLFALRPYKGDFHMHSTSSDGNIAPERVVARCRAKGLDFMALTDHGQYAPSLSIIERFADIPLEMKLMPGEEVHPAETPPHIINFGGGFSVNDYMKNKVEDTKARIDAKLAELPDNRDLEDPWLKYQVASAETAFDLIRESGGIAMYCHPYWRPFERNQTDFRVVNTLFDRAKFDVLEVIGGYTLETLEENALAVAKYQESRAKGQVIPVAGVSDAHTYEPGTYFWWYYTIVFAKSAEMKDLAEAIRANRSLAVEDVEQRFPRYYGEFRLIKFQYFLKREFYPIHDAVCAEQAVLLDRILDGDAAAMEELKQQQTAVEDLFKKYYQQ